MASNKALDEALLEGLQQARKKMPRNFALIARGAEVVGLIVQKKPIPEGVATKAKAERKGNAVIHGVCQGDGPDLLFEVVGTEPAIQTRRVKDFIAEQTGLTVKPQWLVVNALTGVPDDEGAPRLEDPDAPDDALAEWQRKLAAWLPAIKAAIATKGVHAAEAGSLLAEANALFKAGDAALAVEKLTACHALATAAGGEHAPDGAAAVEWKEKLATWLPDIKAAIAARGPHAAAIGKLLADANALSKEADEDPLPALAKLAESHALATVGDGGGARAATARWNAVRALVTGRLQAEIASVVATRDPEAGAAEIELKAVHKQLAGELAHKRQAAEMKRWLEQDDVVADVCELAFDLRSPLLGVLEDIAPQLAD